MAEPFLDFSLLVKIGLDSVRDESDKKCDFLNSESSLASGSLIDDSEISDSNCAGPAECPQLLNNVRDLRYSAPMSKEQCHTATDIIRILDVASLTQRKNCDFRLRWKDQQAEKRLTSFTSEFDSPSLINSINSTALWRIGMSGIIPPDAFSVGSMVDLQESKPHSSSISKSRYDTIDKTDYSRIMYIVRFKTIEPSPQPSSELSCEPISWSIGYCFSGAMERAEGVYLNNNADAFGEEWEVAINNEDCHHFRIEYLVDTTSSSLYMWERGDEMATGSFRIPVRAVIAATSRTLLDSDFPEEDDNEMEAFLLSLHVASMSGEDVDHLPHTAILRSSLETRAFYLVRGLLDGGMFPGIVEASLGQWSISPGCVAKFACYGTLMKLPVGDVEFCTYRRKL